MCSTLSTIFSSFWTFIGTLILIGALTEMVFRLVVVPFGIAHGYNFKSEDEKIEKKGTI